MKVFFLLSVFVSLVRAIGQDTCVSFKYSPSDFALVGETGSAPVLISEDDWPGVHRAAGDFVSDVGKVTGKTPQLSNYTSTSTYNSTPVIIGTLGHSSLIDAVLNNTGLDVSSIEGKWEAFTSLLVANPLPGLKSAYVIIGANKRGTIYALYEHSEQIGVSPWYWWADVPITHHDELYLQASGCSHGTPSVKYRGIFLNDEQPALQNWVLEKFTNGTVSKYTNSPFNHFFYEKLFELLLRLKANYLWPAMWGSAFNVDDDQNQYLADFYGVVMGTSHQEPMMRSTPNEWNLFGSGVWNYSTNAQNVSTYFREGAERAKPYESLYSIGMRGAGDLPLSEETNIELLEQIVANQRQVLADVYPETNVSDIPQLWCLYQEVQQYYEGGMRVPDDVVLLWADDTWGNVRRYPSENERNRSGGAGIYYHFDLVGPPRDYKWMTSTQISKVYEQMSLAIDRKADTVWIVNVGDLKPYEMSTEFFISYGWNTTRWNPSNLDKFVSGWASREFDIPEAQAIVVAEIVGNLTRYNARRKPELLNSTTYSLINYREADTMLDQWVSLAAASQKIYDSLPSTHQPAFFELVHHPVQASSTLGRMWIYAGINNLRASQARLSTNDYAALVEDLFEQDYDLETQYHSLLDGKWNHMMDQTHVMYYYWQQPMANTMPPVTKVQAKKQALAGVMRVVPEGTLGAWPGDNPNQCSQGYNCPSPTLYLDSYLPSGNRFIDIGAAGPGSFAFSVTTTASWLIISSKTGEISKDDPEKRVYFSADWSKIPSGTNATASVTISATSQEKSSSVKVSLSIVASHYEVADGFTGFIEGDGGISIEAAHASRNTSASGIAWIEIPNYGRTLSGVTPWPRTIDANFTAGQGPKLEYDFFNFNTIGGSGNLSVTLYVSPSLNANGNDRPLGFAVQIDELAAQTVYFIPVSKPGTVPAAWGGENGFVANSIVAVSSTFAGVQPGAHTLTIWMVEPAVVIQKIVINTGGVRASYLGPPESLRLL